MTSKLSLIVYELHFNELYTDFIVVSGEKISLSTPQLIVFIDSTEKKLNNYISDFDILHKQ